MAYLLSAIIGYFLGCSNMALYIAKYKKINLRAAGSGNLGTANSVILMGWLPGALVCIHDIGKAALAMFIATVLFPNVEEVAAVAGVACIMGHLYPVFLKFKGGKGFASYIGMALMINWQFGLCMVVATVGATVVTDYLVVGTAITVLGLPIFMLVTKAGWLSVLLVSLTTAIILWKHRINFVRMANGTEIGLRRTVKQKDRV